MPNFGNEDVGMDTFSWGLQREDFSSLSLSGKKLAVIFVPTTRTVATSHEVADCTS